jgi:hypothetical protein
MQSNPIKKNLSNISAGNLVRGKFLKSFRLHLSDGSSFRVTGDTILTVVENYDDKKFGALFAKWYVMYEGQIFFVYEEDVEVIA